MCAQGTLKDRSRNTGKIVLSYTNIAIQIIGLFVNNYTVQGVNCRWAKQVFFHSRFYSALLPFKALFLSPSRRGIKGEVIYDCKVIPAPGTRKWFLKRYMFQDHLKRSSPVGFGKRYWSIVSNLLDKSPKSRATGQKQRFLTHHLRLGYAWDRPRIGLYLAGRSLWTKLQVVDMYNNNDLLMAYLHDCEF